MSGNGIKTWIKRSAGLLLMGGLLVLAGCHHGYSYYRPGTTAFVPGDTGLQSRDLVDMTNRLAADLLKIPEIANNPNKVIIVMASLQNKTSTPWQSDQIYLARMRALLNQYARDRIAFVLPPQEVQHLQQKYQGSTGDMFGQSTRGPVQPSGRMIPQYALKGVFYDLPNSATTYYLCTFQLVNLTTGELVWEGHYETRTLNLY